MNRDSLEAHIRTGMEHGPGAVFPACGTGEFHTLDLQEYTTVVTHAVRAVGGKVPVVAGTGGPLGSALAAARAAEAAGADALLVMPPYLVGAPQEGLVAYVLAIASASDLPVIVYHRGNAKFSAESVTRLLEDPRVIGVKDGVGDIATAQRFVLAARRSGRADVLFFNGLLTAEISQLAYRAIGVPLYSSAVFAMAPEIANAFYRAYRSEDVPAISRLLAGFYEPLVTLRDAVPGYAVSLIKAGLRLGGNNVGSVRAPLVDPTPAHEAELSRILTVGRELA